MELAGWAAEDGRTAAVSYAPALIGIAGTLLGVALGARLTSARERRGAQADALEALAAVRPLLYQGGQADLHAALDRVEARALRISERLHTEVRQYREAAVRARDDSFTTPDLDVVQISTEHLDRYDAAARELARAIAPDWHAKVTRGRL